MSKRISAEAKPHSPEQLLLLKAAGSEKGLASLAGGWEGSDELVDLLARIRRTGPRVIPEMEG